MALPTQPYKGARDFYPEDKRLQKYMFGVLRRVVESFGYQEYDAPIIEPLELYLTKTSEEIVAEQTYSFVDRGGRNITLRPEMTPSVSRMVAARRQELAYPLRWYSLPNLWRYERPQRGRLREHWQLNVDIFGVPGIAGDHEIILIADALMQAFGADRDKYEIRINSRSLVNWLLLEYLRFEYTQAANLMRLIDRSEKIPEKEFHSAVEAILTPTQKENHVLEQLTALLTAKRVSELPMVTQQHPAVAELLQLFDLLSENKVTNAVFDLRIMRGFDYYTNIVFEVYDSSPVNNRSMFGGGRYDGLVGEFGVEPLPTVGFGMGDVTLQNFIEGHKLVPNLSFELDAAVILIGDVYKSSQKILSDMRREGLNISVDATDRRLDAKIKSAVKTGLPFAIFIGEEELTSGRYKLRNLHSGHEEDHSLERIISLLAARHKPSTRL
jgi:histidyl-tRNA synthetase